MLIPSLIAAALTAQPEKTVHEPLPTPGPTPVVIVDRDNVAIGQSCRVEIPEGLVIEDADGNGVIQIVADDIEIDFNGALLRGGAPETPPDELAGTGIVIEHQSGVTLKNLSVSGFKVGLLAKEADRLVVDAGVFADNYRQRLGSTPKREDSSDWLSPHHNENNEWTTRYGAAISVEESGDIVIRRVTVRRGQNGILLDTVHNAKVYDNDASFLSGWGLALWRSSGNTITRNAFDFCVRGHVEGVYNRGQDSAGILLFEQSSDNIIAENSITHSGDGIFGFAGLDALGQKLLDEKREAIANTTTKPDADAPIDDPKREIDRRVGLGCNNNIFARNDLSYAPAHGLEITFSFGNIITGNRCKADAICGIWGGFSQNTLITENLFEDDGGMAYGLERGGVNIEHGAGNAIVANRFVNDRAGVHLWHDDPGDAARTPWGVANYRGVTGNIITDNAFIINAQPQSFHRMSDTERMVAIHLRNDGGPFEPVTIINNTFDIDDTIGERIRTSGDTPTRDDGAIPGYYIPEFTVLGDTHPVRMVDGVPVSSRESLGGREAIIMDQWGPWDHENPILRQVDKPGGAVAVYEVIGVDELEATSETEGVSVSSFPGPIPHSMRVKIEAQRGVAPYRVRIRARGVDQTVTGTLVRARWLCRAFSWKDLVDPREDFDEWRKLARGPGSRPFGVRNLSLPFGFGSPVDLARSGQIEDTSGRLTQAPIDPDYFGVEAIGRVRMPAGRWRVSTVSDDGVRVMIVSATDQNRTIIDNWTWHGPAKDEGSFTVSSDDEIVMIRVYYFEIDGYATLELALEPEP